MVTKLVFVVTSSLKAHYIEMALMAVYSARYWNPQAHIVLLVDDKTDSLLVDGRAKILDYVSEKIVVPFSDDKSMYYRSRWIKTNLIRLIGGEGSLLYLDCDVIVTHSLEDIDSFSCKLGAVPDANIFFKDFPKPLADLANRNAGVIGFDLSDEIYYFNGGVMYSKICKESTEFYDRWHQIWENQPLTLTFDQPALTKANIECGHIIERIPDTFNCIMYVRPDFADDAHIVHFAGSARFMWLYSTKLLDIIEKEGIQDWLAPCILKPSATYYPFRNALSKMSWCDLKKRIKDLAKSAKIYGTHIDPAFVDYHISYRFKSTAKKLLIKKHYYFGSALTLVPKWICLRLHIGKNK